MLDPFYISFLNTIKKQFGKSAFSMALAYISFFEISLMLLVGLFFAAFGSQMNIPLMSSLKGWTLFALLSIFIVMKNWLRYNGKKRIILKAKAHKKHHLITLIMLPLVCLLLAFIFYQSV